jgi:membrane protein DedA with SNARE-associated domain
MITFQEITFFAQAHRYLGYAILFLGMLVEGETFLMAYGILTHLKAFDWGDAFLIAYFGVIFSDILWYHLGVFLKKRYPSSRFLNNNEKRVRKYFPDFEKKPAKALLMSKFIAGTNHATLMIAGILKVDFKYFFKLQVMISFLWVATFLTLGFLFGFAALGYSHKFEKFLLMALVLLISAKLLEQLLKYIFAEKSQNKNLD